MQIEELVTGQHQQIVGDNKMPNYILKLILKTEPLDVDEMLSWLWYVPYSKEKDYILKVANTLQK